MPGFTKPAIMIGILLAPAILPAAEPQPHETDSAMPAKRSGSIEETIWRLESYKSGGKDRQPFSSRDATLRLQEGRISGSGGCNRLMGSYNLNGKRLSIEVGGMTRMACPKGMEQEQAVTKAMAEVAGYELQGERLVLLDKNLSPVLVYVQLKPLALTGTDWRLTRYNNGNQGITTPSSGTDLRLELSEDGRLEGNGGCNAFRGGYTLNRDWLVFGSIASTRKTCPSPEGVMKQEAEFLQALQSAAKYKIEGGELTLINGDGKPAAIFSAAE